jgi:iron complex outermembrane recepter protein
VLLKSLPEVVVDRNRFQVAPCPRRQAFRRATGALAVVGAVLGLVALPSSAEAQQPAADPAPAGEPAAPAAPAPAAPAPAAPAPAADSTAAPAEPSAGEPEPAVPGDLDAADASLEVPEEVSPGQAEVVVTVDRRAKNLQDYSGTASAFSERTLTSVGVTDVRDLAVMVPGLQVATQESGTALFIRGVGSDNFTELGDPAVALHVDGVYMPRPRGLGNIFFDIARVEVNSGPQGTLRGRNAVGGSVNIVTNQPKLGEFESNASATFGSYNLRSYQGMINIPVGETLALRVAAASQVHDPYWINAGPLYDIPGAQSADNWSVRATVRWQPVKALNISAAYDRIEEHGTGYLGAQFMQNIGGVNQLIADPNDYDTIGNPRSIYQRGWNPSTDLWHQGVRANVSYDTGPAIFEALASYRWQDYKQLNSYPARVVLDQDAYLPGVYENLPVVNPDVFSGNIWHNTSKATILELRASAPDTARLRWSLGGFYFNEDQGAFLGQTRDPAGGYGGGEFNMPSTIGRSFAGYGDATFDITEDFRVLAGLRVTHEYKERKGGIWAVWTNTGGTNATTGINGLGRFGTEGFAYAGFDRSDYGVPPANDPEARVNWFLDGVKSFGARDQVAQQLCNDPPTAVDGQPQEPRLVLNEEGRYRCNSNGIRSTLPANIFNVVQQDFSVTSNYVDWRVGAEYDLAKQNLLYATVTTGHKAAGFNDTLFQGDTTFNSDYGPEKLLSFELGSKNELFDRKLKLNAAAFFFTYSGQQFQTIVAVGEAPPRNPDGTIATDPATNMPYQDTRSGSAVRQNAQEQTNVYGLDLDLIYALPAGLEAEAHALLMDSRFSDGTYVIDTRLDPGTRNAEVDLGGNWLPRTSAYSLNYNLSQMIFTGVGAFDWIIQGQTVGTSYQTVFNGNGKRLVKKSPNWDPLEDADPLYQATLADPSRLTDEVPVHTTVNLGAGWKHPDGRLSIRGSISNLFDVTYATYIASSNGGNLRFYNNQRLGSVTVRLDW